MNHGLRRGFPYNMNLIPKPDTFSPGPIKSILEATNFISQTTSTNSKAEQYLKEKDFLYNGFH